MSIRLTLQLRIDSVANKREHWGARARRAKTHRQTAFYGMSQHRRPELPVTIKLTRIAPRALDGDNLQSSFKAVRDGIADWMKVDDGNAGITWLYEQERGKPREYDARVEVA